MQAGDVYNHLTLVKKESGKYWQCRCECGTMRLAHEIALRSGATVSCGCIPRKVKKWPTVKECPVLQATANGEITLDEASRRLNIPRSRVRHILNQSGVRLSRRGRRTMAKMRALLRPYTEDFASGRLEAADLAGILKLPINSVARWLEVLGVRRRVRPYKGPGPSLVISDQDCQLYQDGAVSRADLAARYGRSVRSVAIALRRQGALKQCQGREGLVLSEADCQRLRDRTVSLRGLARELGVDLGAVMDARLRQNVRIRGEKRA